MEETERRAIVEGLSRLLAYLCALPTNSKFSLECHGHFVWNTSPHADAQYTELAGGVDVIAERIRALGFPPRHFCGIHRTILNQRSSWHYQSGKHDRHLA